MISSKNVAVTVTGLFALKTSYAFTAEGDASGCKGQSFAMLTGDECAAAKAKTNEEKM